MDRDFLKFSTEVGQDGRIELRVPWPRGTRVTVTVLQTATRAEDDLVAVAESSLSFWDNPLDDEDWNNA